MKAWIDDLMSATAFLTRIPVAHSHGAVPSNFARAQRVFPIIGAVIGAAIGLVYLALLAINLPAMAAAALAIGFGAALTGALHEDGLGDVADGFGGGWDKASKLEIMKDSRLGTYGALALLVVIVTKISALTTLSGSAAVLALIAAHALSRAPLCIMAANMPYARADGLAASAARPDIATMMTTVAMAIVVAFLTLPLATAVLAIALVAICALCAALLAERQIGGQTGDVLGCAQQLCETAILLLLAAR